MIAHFPCSCWKSDKSRFALLIGTIAKYRAPKMAEFGLDLHYCLIKSYEVDYEAD